MTDTTDTLEEEKRGPSGGVAGLGIGAGLGAVLCIAMIGVGTVVTKGSFGVTPSIISIVLSAIVFGVIGFSAGIKSVVHFSIALVLMFGYYFMIDVALMKVQGLDFFYLWTSGSGGGAGH